VPLKAGDAFFLSGTGGYWDPSKAHLMVCLVAPTKKGNVIIVPVVSKQAWSDLTCELAVGEHPFLKHESCASYDLTKAVSDEATTKALDCGELTLEPPVSADLLLRLQVGLVRSDETPEWALREAKDTGLIAHLQREGVL
jgi:hypothetical protein